MRTKTLFLALLVLFTSAASQASGSDKKTVSSPEFPKALGPYSQAVVAGGFVFVAGQGPINPKTQKMDLGDIKSETRLELTNISNILKAANSSIENVVKVSVFLADVNDFEAMNEVYREFFKDNFPARTGLHRSPTGYKWKEIYQRGDEFYDWDGHAFHFFGGIPLKNDGSLALYEGKEQEEYLRELAESIKKGAQL